MKKLVTMSAIASFVALGLLSPRSSAVPAPADRLIKWEYGEIVSRTRFGRNDPNVPAKQDAEAPPAIRWITASMEINAATWEELAEKLKAPLAAKEAATLSHKLRVFDRLGAEGWEMVSQSSTTTGATGTWTFKRRAP